MSEKIEPYVWKIAGVVILGMTMSILDTTIVNVALDTLGRDLHTTIAQIQWVATGYLLALAAVIPLTGWAARRFGAKRVYLASIGLFTIGSALCGVAESSTSLILFRVLQGVGGGMIMPVSQMIMAEVAGPKRMGRVMGIVVMPAMLAPILGPVVGGLILQNLHWSWIFFVNVPIGIVAGILGWRMLPDSDLGEAGKLDWIGLALLATSMPLVVYGLSEIATKESFTAPTVVWPIVAGIAARRRLRLARAARRAAAARRPPLREPDLRRRLADHLRPRRGPLRGDDPGAALLPAGARRERHRHRPPGRAAGARDAAGRAVDRAHDRPLRRRPGGLRRRLDPDPQLAAARLHRRRHLDRSSSRSLLLVRGVGIGLSFIPTTTVAFAALRTDQLSDATPQMNVLQRVGGAIGTAVLAVVLQRASAGAHGPTELASAFGTAYWWALGICAASLIPVLVLLRAEGPKEDAPGPSRAAVEEAEEFVEPIGA